MSAPRYAGVQVQLGGTAYVLPPLTLGALEEFDERIKAFEAAPLVEQVQTVVDLVHRALKRNYPELQRAELTELMDVSNMFDLFVAVLRVSGLIQGDDAEKARAMVRAAGTGSPSTPISPPVSDGPSSTAGSGSLSLN